MIVVKDVDEQNTTKNTTHQSGSKQENYKRRRNLKHNKEQVGNDTKQE